MGSTNKTANLELSQFLGSDKPAWLVDYNGDMQKIDTAYGNVSAAATAAQSTANTANGKADNNAQAISTLDSELNGAQGVVADVTHLTGDINTINSLIGNGEPTTTDKTIIGAINELHSNEGNLASLSTSNKNSLVGAINEVKDNADAKLSMTAVAEVQADGVKTWSELFASCASQMEIEHAQYHLVLKNASTGIDYDYHSGELKAGEYIIFFGVYVTLLDAVLENIHISKASNADNKILKTTLLSTPAISFADNSSTVPSSDFKIIIYKTA